jgi:hypothetical protein
MAAHRAGMGSRGSGSTSAGVGPKSGEVGVIPHRAAAPQASFGRLHGDQAPQSTQRSPSRPAVRHQSPPQLGQVTSINDPITWIARGSAAATSAQSRRCSSGVSVAASSMSVGAGRRRQTAQSQVPAPEVAQADVHVHDIVPQKPQAVAGGGVTPSVASAATNSALCATTIVRSASVNTPRGEESVRCTSMPPSRLTTNSPVPWRSPTCPSTEQRLWDVGRRRTVTVSRAGLLSMSPSSVKSRGRFATQVPSCQNACAGGVSSGPCLDSRPAGNCARRSNASGTS